MKLLIIIALYVLSNVNSYPLLKKYGTVTMQDKYVLFESKDFNNDEEMHFKLQAGEDYFDYYHDDYTYTYHSIHDIIYYYSDSAGNRLTSDNYAYRKNHKIEDGYLENSYFTIKKKSSEYSPTNGNYMMIYFPNLYVDSYYEAIISNTKEDEGKIETWVIVVIVVVIVAIIVGIIIYCVCRRIRMKKAQQAAMAANAATIAAQNQAAANYAAQNAAYEAAAQNAYIAEQNYQAQAYQAQVYQNKNYMSPPGVVSDAGYTSKAVI